VTSCLQAFNDIAIKLLSAKAFGVSVPSVWKWIYSTVDRLSSPTHSNELFNTAIWTLYPNIPIHINLSTFD